MIIILWKSGIFSGITGLRSLATYVKTGITVAMKQNCGGNSHANAAPLDFYGARATAKFVYPIFTDANCILLSAA